MATVRLRGQLKKLAGDHSEHPVDGATVLEVLRGLEQSQEQLAGWVLDERGLLRHHINVFVNGEQAGEETAVAPDDRVEIIPAISGG